MTLPSVLVAAAIGAIVMAALVNSLQNVQKGQAGVRNAMDFDLFRQNVYTMLRTQQNCGAGFWSTGGTTKLNIPASFGPGTKIDVPVLKLAGSTLLDMSNPKISGGIQAETVELESTSAAAPETVAGVSYNTYTATLRIRARRVGEGYGRPIFEQTFPLKLYSNPAAGGALQLCTATSDIAADSSGGPSSSGGSRTCPAGTFMIGTESNGNAVCGLPGGQIRLAPNEDLPAGADPLNCLSNKRSYSCENTGKSRCVFESDSSSNAWLAPDKKWKVEFLRKDGAVRKEIDCKGGVIADLAEAGSIPVAPDALIPSGVDQDDYNVICKTRNGFQNSCSLAINQKVNKIPKTAVAGECYNSDEAWVIVKETKSKGNNDPQVESCSKGLLLEPLE